MDAAGRRASLRFSGDFVLRWAEMAHELFQGDHLRALVLNVILWRNVHHIHLDPELNLRYGGLEPPPDEARRPVTVSEAARALRMPRVTTGRYVQALVGTGSLRTTGGAGYIVPLAELLRDGSLAMIDPNYQNLLRMMQRLRASGLLPRPPEGPIYGRAERYRLTLRAAGEFVSDWIDVWNRHYPTGYLYGLIFVAILQANDRSDEAAAFDLADEGKTPISAHATATSLRLSPETVRRHVLRLEADGLLTRLPDGLIVPRSALESSVGQSVLDSTCEALARLDAIMTRFEVDVNG